jgi:hypothetical protein
LLIDLGTDKGVGTATFQEIAPRRTRVTFAVDWPADSPALQANEAAVYEVSCETFMASAYAPDPDFYPVAYRVGPVMSGRKGSFVIDATLLDLAGKALTLNYLCADIKW